MADLLRAKDLTFGRSLTDDEIMSPALPGVLVGNFAAAVPVFRFLATLRP